MISINVGLQFLHHLRGEYQGASNEAQLRIWTCGYGVALELRTKQGVQLVGVVGAMGLAVELFAQIGLPNVIRFSGNQTAPQEMCLNADEPPLCLRLRQEAGIVHFSWNWAGKEPRFYSFSRSDVI